MPGPDPKTIDREGRPLTELELAMLEAEAEAPLNVGRLFAGFTDLDLKIFAMKCAGMPLPVIAEACDVSPDRVRKSIRGRAPVYQWLDQTIPETYRDRAERERERQRDKQWEDYVERWPRLMEQVDKALDAGDLSVVKVLFKDLAPRMFGPVTKKKIVEHEHRGEVHHRPVPATVTPAVTAILDGDVDDD